MSAQAQALAERFERELAALIEAVEACQDEQLAGRCADTGWAGLVQVDHLAAAEAFVTDRLQAIVAGHRAPPLPRATIEAANDQRALEAATVSKEAALAALRENGARTADFIRGLSDEQLERRGEIVVELGEKSVREWIEVLSIGEIERHGGALRQAIG